MSAAAPTVGWPANGSSRLGVKILTRALLTAFLGSNTNTVSDRLNSAAIACMRASSSPCASKTTASGLPASGVSVNTSRVWKGRVIDKSPAPAALLEPAGRLRAFGDSMPGKQRLAGTGPGDIEQRSVRLREANIIGQPVVASHALEGPLDRVALRRPEGIENIGLARADGRPGPEGQPRLDALANSDMAAGGGRMLCPVMDRLRLRQGRCEDDSERDGPQDTDRM